MVVGKPSCPCLQAVVNEQHKVSDRPYQQGGFQTVSYLLLQSHMQSL